MEEQAVSLIKKNPLWRNRTFSSILLGYTLSIFGDSFHSIALNIWVLQKTGSAKAMSAIMITSMIISMLFGSVAGTLADRIERKKLMWRTDLISCVLALGIAFCIYIKVPFLVILILTACLTFAGLFQSPALQSSIADIVGKENIQQATGAMSLADNIARISGLALGGVVVASFGGLIAIIFNSGTFLLSTLVVLLARSFPNTIKKDEKRQKTFREDFVGGFKTLWQNAFTRCVMLLSPTLVMFFTTFLMLTQVTAIKVWKASPSEFGTLESCIPLGYFLGAAIIMTFEKKIKGRGHWIIGSMLFMAPLFLIISFLTKALYAIPFIFIIGLTFSFCTLLVNVIMRVEVDSDLQGRMFGILGSLSSVAPPIALAIFSFLADIYGPTIMLVVNGMGLLLIGIIALIFLKPIRTYN